VGDGEGGVPLGDEGLVLERLTAVEAADQAAASQANSYIARGVGSTTGPRHHSPAVAFGGGVLSEATRRGPACATNSPVVFRAAFD
jgi:hypothetical protein